MSSLSVQGQHANFWKNPPTFLINMENMQCASFCYRFDFLRCGIMNIFFSELHTWYSFQFHRFYKSIWQCKLPALKLMDNFRIRRWKSDLLSLSYSPLKITAKLINHFKDRKMLKSAHLASLVPKCQLKYDFKQF